MSGAGRRTADLRDGLVRKSRHRSRWQGRVEGLDGRTLAVVSEKHTAKQRHTEDASERHVRAAELAYGIRVK